MLGYVYVDARSILLALHGFSDHEHRLRAPMHEELDQLWHTR